MDTGTSIVSDTMRDTTIWDTGDTGMGINTAIQYGTIHKVSG